jgi:hypothetical protein
MDGSGRISLQEFTITMKLNQGVEKKPASPKKSKSGKKPIEEPAIMFS